jgi:HlyD family secretion protein
MHAFVWIKRGIYLLVLIAVAWAIRQALAPKPVSVDIGVVDRGPIEVTVNEEGMTRIRDTYLVVAPISGNVLRFPLEPGDAVIQGVTVVAEIEPALPGFLDARQREELAANLEAAKSGVRVAEARLSQSRVASRLARSELKRLQSLDLDTLVSKRELENAELEVASRKAAEASAEAELELSQQQVQAVAARLIGPERPELCTIVGGGSCVEIKSPANGLVLQVFNDSERVVAAGENLMEIGDPGNLEIVVDLLSTDAVQVKPGQKVRIDRWGGEATLEGTVRTVEPVGFQKVSALGIEEQRVNTIIDILPDQDTSGLGHQFRIHASIVVWEKPDALRVPMGALFRSDGNWAVYLAEDGVAGLRTVEIGRWNEEFAEVVSGIETGSEIILHPGDTVREGVQLISR